MSRTTVVVTDAGDPQQFVSCLTWAHRTTPEDVAVVGVSAHFPHLPSPLAARVEQVRVRGAEAVHPAVDALVADEPGGSRIVVVDARAALERGWFESAIAASDHAPHLVGVYGAGAPPLLRMLPGGRSPSSVTSYPVAHVAGVRELPPRGAAVPTPRGPLEQLVVSRRAGVV